MGQGIRSYRLSGGRGGPDEIEGGALIAHHHAERPEDRRAAPRQSMLIRSAKLVIDGREYLCVIRDVSESGISMRIFHPLPECEVLELVLGNGDRHKLKPIRREPTLVACEFVGKPSITRIVEEPSAFRRRQTRIQLTLPATIEGSFGSEMVMITNISQQGARIECERRLPVHGRIVISARGLPDKRAKVCWSHRQASGVTFEDFIRFEEFAQLVAEI